MADSRARVRMFSDDGRCVADPVLMRRALEYAASLDAVVAQHAFARLCGRALRRICTVRP